MTFHGVGMDFFWNYTFEFQIRHVIERCNNGLVLLLKTMRDELLFVTLIWPSPGSIFIDIFFLHKITL